MNIKQIFFGMGVLGLFGSCTGKSDKVNIVFILADDLGYSQLGCTGSDYYQTPNIDKLASQGMRFSTAYAAAAICSPTRASIMTGKYPARLHLTDYIAGNTRDDYMLSQPEWQKYLPLEEVTFAEVLKDDGYNTAHFGKWHLSQAKMPPGSLPYNPDKQGFDEYFITYKPEGDLLQPWQDADNDAHNVDTITNRAVEFIERNKSNPFFLFVSHNTIHDPLAERQQTIRKYEQQEASDDPENHPVIAAMIERLDDSCGRILAKISELGLEENTIVIFYSDNGGRPRYAAQSPFRAGKGWLYEGGIRVPLIVKWNGTVGPGTVSDVMVTSNDLFPTFLEMARLQPPSGIDGKSFVPVLKGSGAELHNSLYWHYPHYHIGSGMKPAGAVREGNWKLIEWYEERLTGKKEKSIQLYNLDNDIGEIINLSDSLPEVASRLQNKLDAWRSEVGAQMPEINQRGGTEQQEL